MALAKIERERLAAGEGCLAKAADDEPVFILRGQDLAAPAAVVAWAHAASFEALRSPKGMSRETERKILDAFAVATEMNHWQMANHGKVPD